MNEARRPRPVVAIDGPAGAGKSTVAQLLADGLGFLLVDTGAMYRGVALSALERGVELDDGPALGELARSLSITFEQGSGQAPRLQLDGQDRSADIRRPEVAMAASKVSQRPEVRRALLGMQRSLGAEGGVVLEGRDIGTVVFPDAEVKIFLTAQPEVRASRRVAELKSRGIEADLPTTLREVKERDHLDSVRPIAPLRPADDAVIVDTTGLAIERVVEQLVALVNRATLK